MTEDTSGRSKICIVVHGAGWAGTERHVRSLVERLPERGLEVHLVTSESGPLQSAARASGAAVHEVPRPSSWGYARGLLHLFRELRPDIVHSHSGRIPAWVARSLGIHRILDTRHGLLDIDRGEAKASGWKRRGESWKCRAADLTLTVAESDRTWLVSSGVPERRVQTIYNGLAADLADEGGTEPRGGRSAKRVRQLGLVGRLAPQKCPNRALELMCSLKEGAVDDYELIVYGSGPLEHEMERSIRSLRLEGCVDMAGVVSDVPTRLASLDALLLPSLAEGIPYVVLEALAAGIPILATPVGGIAEVLTGPILSRGILPWNVDGWSERIGALTEPPNRSAWRDAAASRVKQFTETQMIDQLLKAYRLGN